MAEQLELFGPCIMGRKSRTEADRLLDCEQRAATLGLGLTYHADWSVLLRGPIYWPHLAAGPYMLSDEKGYPIASGLDCEALEDKLEACLKAA
jgi:hypothetical protein